MLGNKLPKPESTTAQRERQLPDKQVTVAHSTPATCLSANHGRISYDQTWEFIHPFRDRKNLILSSNAIISTWNNNKRGEQVMTFSKPNRSAATLTTTRVDPAPVSGICVTCVDGCEGPCEIGRSALKGREVIYPTPFGTTTSGSEKDYPCDFSH